MSAQPQQAGIEASRQLILEEIGDPPDLTFVRGLGSWGDELISEGTRELLLEHIYREIDLMALSRARGLVGEPPCVGAHW